MAEILSLHAEMLSLAEIAISACKDVISARDSYLSISLFNFSSLKRVVAKGKRQWCRRPHFKTCAPNFMFGPSVAPYIQYCI